MLALHVSFKSNWQSDVFPRIWEVGGAGGKYCFYISIARAVQSTGSTDSLVLLWRCGDLQGVFNFFNCKGLAVPIDVLLHNGIVLRCMVFQPQVQSIHRGIQIL